MEGGEKGAKVFRKGGEEGASRGSRADKIQKEYQKTGEVEQMNCKTLRVMGDGKNGGTDII